MFVRMARFEGGTAAGIDEELRSMQEQLASPELLPPGLRGVKRVMVLADKESGVGIDLTFCATDEELQAADEALDGMSPSSGASGKRVAVETFEVAFDGQPG